MSKPNYKVRIWKKGGSGRKTMHGHMGPYANRKAAEEDAKAYTSNSKKKVTTEIIKVTPLKNPGIVTLKTWDYENSRPVFRRVPYSFALNMVNKGDFYKAQILGSHDQILAERTAYGTEWTEYRKNPASIPSQRNPRMGSRFDEAAKETLEILKDNIFSNEQLAEYKSAVAALKGGAYGIPGAIEYTYREAEEKLAEVIDDAVDKAGGPPLYFNSDSGWIITDEDEAIEESDYSDIFEIDRRDLFTAATGSRELAAAIRNPHISKWGQ